jgi:hypothetical protein
VASKRRPQQRTQEPAKTDIGLSQRHRDILKQGDKLFLDRQPLMSLWQEIADQFYPERADFTVTRSMGKDFAGNLTTSYPILARRDLGNSFSSMLRPTEKPWFHIKTQREPIPEDARQWLEWCEGTQRRAMYDRASLFVRATKEADHDFAAFGQCVITPEMVFHPETGEQLLYRCWHLRDTVWCENSYGVIDTVQRKAKLSARALIELFGEKNVHPNVIRFNREDPYRDVNFRHIVIPSDNYDSDLNTRKRFKFVSLYIDTDNNKLMEEVPQRRLGYVIPRWQTVSSPTFGSQYAYSPAVVAALPDARLIQEMTFTLLEAGQVTVRPPLVAVQEAVRSAELFAGGVSWVDSEYDGKLRDAIAPLYEAGNGGMPIGFEMIDRVMSMIKEAFFLNKLNLPQRAPEMTAYEVGQRIQEYIRNALPLFEPMETEYNGALCDDTFELLKENNAFGTPEEIPQSLQGADIQFRFESPLHDAIESEKPQKFIQVKQLIDEMVPYYPLAPKMLKTEETLRDVLHSVAPANWLQSEKDMLKIQEAEAQRQAVQSLLGTVSQGAQVAQQIGDATAAIRQGAAPANIVPSKAA